MKINKTLTTLVILQNLLEQKYIEKIKYLIECNDVYEQLSKMKEIVIKNEELRKLVNSLFLSFYFGDQSVDTLPNEMKYEIARQFVLELEQNVE